MRSLKEVCEGLLAGQESTLAAGDAINNQFEKLKAMVCNPKEYERWNQSYYALCLDRSININELLGILIPNLPNKIQVLNIKCEKYKKPDGYGGYYSVWEWWFNIVFIKNNVTREIKIKSTNQGLSFPKFITKYVAPHFKDLDSFKKLIEDKLCDR